jgi:hypothetical protein
MGLINLIHPVHLDSKALLSEASASHARIYFCPWIRIFVFLSFILLLVVSVFGILGKLDWTSNARQTITKTVYLYGILYELRITVLSITINCKLHTSDNICIPNKTMMI